MTATPALPMHAAAWRAHPCRGQPPQPCLPTFSDSLAPRAAGTNSSAIARASFTRTASFPATRAAALSALECSPATAPPPQPEPPPTTVAPQHTLASNPDYA